MAFLRGLRVLWLLVVLLVLTLAFAQEGAAGRDRKKSAPVSVGDVSYIDMETYATGAEFDGTEIGGFSGITYDAARDVYYVLSDDRSEEAPSRYYTVDIDVVEGELVVTFLDVGRERRPF